MTVDRGTLYLVGTPIGNLEDLSPRAARILGAADLIAAEDTRRTLKLLNHLNLSKPIVSYHEHNRRQAGERLLAALMEGKTVALVSDAGMPVVSDPGSELVAAAAGQGCPVAVIPGPCAVSSALALSGLDGGRFLFEGFLPRQGKPRRLALEGLRGETRTIVLYEAPHRLVKTLGDLLETLGDRQLAVCNDITKRYERTDRMALSAALALFQAEAPRGEFVLVLGGAQPVEAIADVSLPVKEHVRRYLAGGMAKKDAVKQTAKDRGVHKSEVYSQVLDLDDSNR